MSNISISEIQTSATVLNDNDYLLVSKSNADGSSFTSAKIKGSNLSGLSNVRFVENDVMVYISPQGNDNNSETQFEKFGTSEQSNYPLFTVNAAVRFLNKFRKVGNCGVNYKILCENGTYTYNTEQVISHPDCCMKGSYISIAPRIFDSTNRVIFINNGSNVNFFCNCNVSFYYLKITNTQLVNSCAFATYSFDTRISGCEIYNLDRVVANYTQGGTITVTSYKKSDYTLETIESNTYPSYFHDITYQCLAVSRNGNVSLDGFLKFKNCGGISNIYYKSLLYTFSSTNVTRYDISCSAANKVQFAQHDLSDIIFSSDASGTFEMNYWCTDTSSQYTNKNELFQVTPQETNYNPKGRVIISSFVEDGFHIVNKF